MMIVLKEMTEWNAALRTHANWMGSVLEVNKGNPVAKDRTPKYRMQVVPNKKHKIDKRFEEAL